MHTVCYNCHMRAVDRNWGPSGSDFLIAINYGRCHAGQANAYRAWRIRQSNLDVASRPGSQIVIVLFFLFYLFHNTVNPLLRVLTGRVQINTNKPNAQVHQVTTKSSKYMSNNFSNWQTSLAFTTEPGNAFQSSITAGKKE